MDPHDPFAEREVLVAFDIGDTGITLLSVEDEDGHDILSDLDDDQRANLRCELAAQPWGQGFGQIRPGRAAGIGGVR